MRAQKAQALARLIRADRPRAVRWIDELCLFAVDHLLDRRRYPRDE